MDQKPSSLLVSSAGVYFAASVAMLFTPEELLAQVVSTPTPLDVGLLQILSAAVFGFAMLNWMSRFSRVGGIFGRPLVLANFVHAAIATSVLVRAVLGVSPTFALLGPLAAYAALAVGFGAKLFLPTPGPS